MVERVRDFFVGGYGTGTAWWAVAMTVLLVVLGWFFGARRLRRESS
ncbi:hypothetical protein [Blastococcus sp. SYSU DS0539]